MITPEAIAQAAPRPQSLAASESPSAPPATDTARASDAAPASDGARTSAARRATDSFRGPADGRMARAFAGIGTAVLVVAALSLARDVLIPLVLAVFLAFLLSPMVSRFERRGAGRILAVVLVCVLAFSLLAAIAYGLARQLASLGDELPRYESNVRTRVAAMRDLTRGTVVRQIESTADVVLNELQRDGDAPTGSSRAAAAPRTVVVSREPSVLLKLPSLLASLSTASLVVVLVIFILLERRELRNRLLSLAGHAHMPVTTRALDEAAQRITRYLVAQTAINASFGVAIGLGLYLIGVPYALLCGFVAGALRFLPYVGSLVGATLAVGLALASLPGWNGPLSVVALIAAAEVCCNLILEPWLYGQSAGVSQVALLVAVAFWTWLWGAVGLVVATPLTVCLVVVSRHVPELGFLSVLLSSEEPLDLDQRLYQRLLAGDAEEAAEIVGEFAAAHPSERLYDELLLPVLARAGFDRERGRLSPDDAERLLHAARKLVDATHDTVSPPTASDAAEAPDADDAGAVAPILVSTYAATGEADLLATTMLRHLTHGARVEFGATEPRFAGADPQRGSRAVACIVALSSDGVRPARRLAARIRRRAPDTAILVVAWRGLAREPSGRPLDLTEAQTAVVGSLLEARDRLWQLGGATGNADSTTAV